MNLIEQLGEYEKAKIRLGSCDITLAYYQELDRQLLEYRRANNIFEVGDKVVDTNYKDSDVQEIKSISGNKMNVFHKNKSHYFTTFVFSFRHATPEEIAVGKRL